MKVLFWISLCLPLAVLAEDIDYFNESIEHVNAPASVEPPPAAVPKSEPKKGWGQGALEYFEKLAGSLLNHPAPVPTTTTPRDFAQQLNGEYLQKKLKEKAQELTQVRQEILQTTDGQKLQSLTGTLHRLEAEYQQLLTSSKQGSTAPIPASTNLSPMAAPTPPVEKIMSQQPLPVPVQYRSEEDALKAQLDILTQQEKELSLKIKSTPDANSLSTLGGQLERTQQNKSLVMLSLQDVQRRNLQNSPKGFGTALLPPTSHDLAMPMPIPSLTPSIEQVAPPAILTPWPTGWGGFKDPAAATAPIQPAGTPITSNDLKQIQAQAAAQVETKTADKKTHTTYGAHSRPLWTPKDSLEPSARKSVMPSTPVDHRRIIEQIRKEKLFT